MKKLLNLLLFLFLFTVSRSQEKIEIPLPEHPRPDFMREQWMNLNGQWDFRFDKQNTGETEKWFVNPSFDKKILVPFPWGSKLSGVNNDADIAWYSRKIDIPSEWQGKQIFIIFGASDWKSKAWLDGNLLGEFQGGYTPFEFDLSPYVKPGSSHTLVVKVDDTPHPFKLEGKQGYGEAKGIWQTVYLETRGKLALKYIHFTPDIDKSQVTVRAILNSPAQADVTLKMNFMNGEQSKPEIVQKVKKGSSDISFIVPVEKMHLWNLDDPFLYDVQVSLQEKNSETDRVTTYFGMRKISTINFYGLNYTYITLNDKPLYLQLTLDQSYNPDSFYTFPSDEFMKNEILNSKKIGLNGNRIHIKVEIPRKLYWADKLGLLIMADVPNSWGEPDDAQKKEWEVAMRGMIERDYNHPAIFAWVLWNETWGLFTTTDKEKKNREYLPETQKWVASMWHIAKELDPTRLVEDNSACNYDHVITDINSWHAYLPGYKWKEFLDNAVEKTFEGSTWNYIGGNKQGTEPMINSECGNVWGYTGSTGDVDWSWDYHIMMNEMRLHPKVAGWLYTEHHDVINEWNGYYKFDRTNKFTGLEEIVPGMSLNDFHSYVYLATRGDLCRNVKAGETVSVPLYASYLTDADYGDKLILRSELVGWDKLGRFETYSTSTKVVPYEPFNFKELEDLQVRMPSESGLAILRLTLENSAGKALHHNFVTFVVEGNAGLPEKTQTVTFKPSSFASSEWSLKQWNILDGLKVNGAGSGYFEYRVNVPENIDISTVNNITLIFEASAKQLFGKDRTDAEKMSGDYMRGGGTFDNSRNPNSYPMTDEYKSPSVLKVRVNGEVTGTYFLEDDPADHRGILSWYSQPKDNKLYEAGSYGYLVKTAIPLSSVKSNNSRTLVIRFEVDKSVPGGLAIYGEKFGRYPLDPTIVFNLK
ncbi:MAG TPA: glycoside hydrolase family 2 TIM barrel-domain containing protein [Bacteroidales bacterium]|nr:glycoside hydrolase family 2 TIM barrel-domain containing protein [Bacteroidales bacterium]